MASQFEIHSRRFAPPLLPFTFLSDFADLRNIIAELHSEVVVRVPPREALHRPNKVHDDLPVVALGEVGCEVGIALLYSIGDLEVVHALVHGVGAKVALPRFSVLEDYHVRLGNVTDINETVPVVDCAAAELSGNEILQ